MNNEDLDGLLEELWRILTKIHDECGEKEMLRHIDNAIIVARLSNPNAVQTDWEKSIIERAIKKVEEQ